jgi:acyl-CoA thioesterase-1
LEYGIGRQMVKLIATLIIMAGCFIGPGPARAEEISLVVLGDSLSAGYQLAPGESFPAQLQAALTRRGHNVDVANAGVSGDTASAALSRLAWAVPEQTDLVIVELGANDALRGISPKDTEKALDEIISSLKKNGARVILAGMLAPPNMGKVFGDMFNAIYPNLAGKHEIALYPFFLEGVATHSELNLADGMHPNAAGVEMITEGILPLVEHALGALQKVK